MILPLDKGKNTYDPEKGPSRRQQVQLMIDVIKHGLDRYGSCTVKAIDTLENGKTVVGVFEMPPKPVAQWIAKLIGCKVKVKPRKWRFER